MTALLDLSGVSVAIGSAALLLALAYASLTTFSRGVYVGVPVALLTAFICSTFTGVLFGWLPARNAARLDPVDALARE